MTDLTTIHPGDVVEVGGDRWIVDEIVPATDYRPAHLGCTRVVSAGPHHARAASRTVYPHQITAHLMAGELTQF